MCYYIKEMEQNNNYYNPVQDPNAGSGQIPQMPPQNYNWQNGEQQDYNVGADNTDDSGQPPKKSAGKIFLIIILIIILLVALIALAGKYLWKNNPSSGTVAGKIDISKLNTDANNGSSATLSPTRTTAEKKDRPHLGNLNAPLVIVEFGDFQCSKCQEEFPQIRQAVLKYPNDVLFIFRNFPIIDDNSAVLAQAGLCADEQGKFWQFHDKLYVNMGSLTSVDAVNALALQSGVDLQKFSACLTSGKYNAMLQQDFTDAQTLGAIGTPTFFVNGNKLEGTISSADWESIILKFKELQTVQN